MKRLIEKWKEERRLKTLQKLYKTYALFDITDEEYYKDRIEKGVIYEKI